MDKYRKQKTKKKAKANEIDRPRKGAMVPPVKKISIEPKDSDQKNKPEERQDISGLLKEVERTGEQITLDNAKDTAELKIALDTINKCGKKIEEAQKTKKQYKSQAPFKKTKTSQIDRKNEKGEWADYPTKNMPILTSEIKNLSISKQPLHLSESKRTPYDRQKEKKKGKTNRANIQSSSNEKTKIHPVSEKKPSTQQNLSSEKKPFAQQNSLSKKKPSTQHPISEKKQVTPQSTSSEKKLFTPQHSSSAKKAGEKAQKHEWSTENTRIDKDKRVSITEQDKGLSEVRREMSEEQEKRAHEYAMIRRMEQREHHAVITPLDEYEIHTSRKVASKDPALKRMRNKAKERQAMNERAKEYKVTNNRRRFPNMEK
ncbi:hypothetical protein NEFER03_0341 [Nematocida sp. LUAm3]|nr:hypothetical protein NEFER03_0341 [Nematocida sp. LUAm3]